MQNKVMVCRVHAGAVFVAVPVIMNGERLLCVFITRKNELARVGVFPDRPIEVGPYFVWERYTRREIPAAVMQDAHKRALEAVAALDNEPQTERITSFAFAADVAS